MSEFNKYSTDGGATFIDVEDSNAVHYGDQSKGYVGKNHLHVTQPSIFNLGGVKVTVNSDGSVTFNGTATSNNSFSLTDWTENLFPEGDYLLSDVNGQAGKIFTFIARKKGTSGVVDNTIDTHAMQNKPFTVDYTEYDYYKVAIYFFSGQTFNNLTIYPMIRLASIPASTYEPWYMSNRELTDNKTDNSVIAPVETGLTASKGYSQDEHFIKDNAFCIALSDISQGDTFVLHTNYEAEDIATYLRSLYINNSDKHTDVDTITIARIFKDANVFVCNLDFTIGSANIGSWTDDVIIFNKLYNSPNITCAIRDVTDSTKSSIDTVLLKANGTNVGFTTSKQLLANHRYQLSFTFIKM